MSQWIKVNKKLGRILHENKYDNYYESVVKPEVGMVRNGRTLGYEDDHAYAYLPCTSCDTPRWTVLVKGRVQYRLCKRCSKVLWWSKRKEQKGIPSRTIKDIIPSD